jgi:hypothetical protein
MRTWRSALRDVADRRGDLADGLAGLLGGGGHLLGRRRHRAGVPRHAADHGRQPGAGLVVGLEARDRLGQHRVERLPEAADLVPGEPRHRFGHGDDLLREIALGERVQAGLEVLDAVPLEAAHAPGQLAHRPRHAARDPQGEGRREGDCDERDEDDGPLAGGRRGAGGRGLARGVGVQLGLHLVAGALQRRRGGHEPLDVEVAGARALVVAGDGLRARAPQQLVGERLPAPAGAGEGLDLLRLAGAGEQALELRGVRAGALGGGADPALHAVLGLQVAVVDVEVLGDEVAGVLRPGDDRGRQGDGLVGALSDVVDAGVDAAHRRDRGDGDDHQSERERAEAEPEAGAEGEVSEAVHGRGRSSEGSRLHRDRRGRG